MISLSTYASVTLRANDLEQGSRRVGEESRALKSDLARFEHEMRHDAKRLGEELFKECPALLLIREVAALVASYAVSRVRRVTSTRSVAGGLHPLGTNPVTDESYCMDAERMLHVVGSDRRTKYIIPPGVSYEFSRKHPQIIYFLSDTGTWEFDCATGALQARGFVWRALVSGFQDHLYALSRDGKSIYRIQTGATWTWQQWYMHRAELVCFTPNETDTALFYVDHTEDYRICKYDTIGSAVVFEKTPPGRYSVHRLWCTQSGLLIAAYRDYDSDYEPDAMEIVYINPATGQHQTVVRTEPWTAFRAGGRTYYGTDGKALYVDHGSPLGCVRIDLPHDSEAFDPHDYVKDSDCDPLIYNTNSLAEVIRLAPASS